MRIAFLAALAALVLACAPLFGQPAGSEFQVNTTTMNGQISGRTAGAPTGRFVVVWTSLAQDPDASPGIYMQRYNALGNAAGVETRVNSFTTGFQGSPGVASDSAGNFVVVWQSDGQDDPAAPATSGVFAQRYDSVGTPLGGEFRVNTFTTGDQYGAVVSRSSSGSFVVAWSSYAQVAGNSYADVFAQRYDGTGSLLGAEFRVNTSTSGYQYASGVAVDSVGGFVVVWGDGSSSDGSGYGVHFTRFDSSGTRLGADFQVNTFTTGSQDGGAIAMDSSGNFVVVWESAAQDGSGSGIIGQRFSSGGAPVGGEFRVNTYTSGDQRYPSVAMDGNGNFIVAWTSAQDDTTKTSNGVYAQRFSSAGAPIGGEFRVNTYTTSQQYEASVAVTAGSSFVVVWRSFDQDGDQSGQFGQRYQQILPVTLTRFTAD